MLEKGLVVKFVGMSHDYSSNGRNKSWMNGSAGTLIRYDKVTNINYGTTTEICMVKLFAPVLSLKGAPIHWMCADGRNLEEVKRVPVTQ